MRLSFDVLFELIDVLCEVYQFRDMCRMMRTCQTLYRRCVPYLIRNDMGISDSQISSFCAFMTRDLSRCRYLQSARLYLFKLPEPSASHLVSVLQHATELSDLAINGQLLDLDSRVVDALATSTSLRKLQVMDVCKNRKFFRHIRSPIVSMEIAKFTEDPEDDFLVSLAGGLQASLEDLHIEEARWGLIAFAVYANVTKLIILKPKTFCGQGLISAFPNLRTLVFGADKPDIALNSDDLEDEREINMEGQADEGTWPELDVLEGHPDILYILGFTCTARKLHINTLGHMTDNEGIVRYTAVIETAQPSHLELTLTSMKLEAMYAALSRTPWDTIRTLHLNVSTTGSPGDYTCPACDAIVSVTWRLLYLDTYHSAV